MPGEWTLITGPIFFQASHYPYEGQIGPLPEVINWLRETMTQDRWRLQYNQWATERTECGLLICWQGDFEGYAFRDVKDAVMFKLTWGGDV